tara:strand:- start:9992 stop:11623 length:1632 start_codon:yes stop_codon:yes gene_type:complete
MPKRKKQKNKKKQCNNNNQSNNNNKQKKILWICDYFFDNTGYSNMSKKLCETLKTRFKLINLFINSEFLNQKINEGEYIVDIPKSVAIEGTCDILKNVNSDIKEYYCDLLMGYYILPKILKKENPDIVVSINDFQVIKKHNSIVKNILPNCKFISYMPVDADYYIKDFFKYLNNVDCVITMNQVSRNILKKDCQKEIYVLPHFIDQKYKKNTDSLQNNRDIIFGKNIIPENFKIVLNINNHNPRKRLDIFIESLYLLNRAYFPNNSKIADIIYVLKTQKEYDLKQKIKEFDDKYNLNLGHRFIHLSEKLNTYQMNILYNCADVFVTTTSGEGFGLTPFEAVSAGVFTLVPDNTCYSEYFPNEMLIECEKKSMSVGRNKLVNPDNDVQYILIQGIPSYTNTTVKYLKVNQTIENFTCRKIIIDLENFEWQLNNVIKERTPFHMVINFDVTNNFMISEKIFDKFKKINFEKYCNWKFKLLGKETFNQHFVKVKIVKINNLVEKLIDFFQNREKYENYARIFKEKIINELSFNSIQKQLFDLPCFN